MISARQVNHVSAPVRRSARSFRDLGPADGLVRICNDIVDIDNELQIERVHYRCDRRLAYRYKRHDRIVFAIRTQGSAVSSIDGAEFDAGWRVHLRIHARALTGGYDSIMVEPAGLEARNIYLRMGRRLFDALAHDMIIPLPYRQDGSFHLHGRLPAAIADSAAEILDSPLQGRPLELLMRGKGMSLAVQCMAAIPRLREVSVQAGRATPADTDVIRRAYELLRDNPGGRVTLHGLARQVGVNVNKLEAGFRSLYGITVFDALRNLRLERAAQLMHSTEEKIGTIARMVGFASATQFAIAFRQRYQVNPREFRRRLLASGEAPPPA